jgi:hypothetical protein
MKLPGVESGRQGGGGVGDVAVDLLGANLLIYDVR